MFQPQCNLVAGCALGATGEIGPTLWKAPTFEDAGAIGNVIRHPNAGYPHVSQQGRG